MKKRAYLKKFLKCKAIIKTREIQKQSLLETLVSGIDYSKDRVKGSPGSPVLREAEILFNIEQDIANARWNMSQIIHSINELEEQEQLALTLKYVDGLFLEEIAKKMGYSTRRTSDYLKQGTENITVRSLKPTNACKSPKEEEDEEV